MAKPLYSLKNNFTAGELAPEVQSRVDLNAFKNGAITMLNALPRPQGGFRRRGGSVFVARAKEKAKKCRLIPFKFNVTQTYMLEVGDSYIRFHTQNARLEETAQNVGSMADNGSGLIRVTLTGHGYSTNDYVAIRSVVGTVESNDDWQITKIDNDTFDLNGSTFTNAYTSGGTASKIIEITAPWAEADLPDLRFAQDADIMFLVHPNYWPRQLTRTSATTFTLTTIDNVVDSTENRWLKGPFQGLNADAAHTMNPSSTTGTITVTSSKSYFTDNMVGMYMRIHDEVGGEQGLVRFTSRTSDLIMNATVESTLSAATTTDNWALGAWGEESGFPADVTFFEQRLVFARTRTEPQTIWMSSTGDIYDYHVGTDDDEPVTIAIRAEDVNVIQWIAAHGDLLVGTQGAEYFVTGGNDSPVTPTNVLVQQQSSFGSEPLRALKIGTSVLYTQRAGRRVRDIAFSLESDRFLSDDVTLLASHIFKDDPIIDLSFQLSPDPSAWFVTEAGVLSSLTIIRSQEVLSWARHTFTNGVVEATGVIPSTTVDNDEVWLCIKRTIDGETVRYIEYLDDDVYVDSALQGTLSPAATTIAGLDHLEGQVVSINGDGAVYVNQTVSGGSITVGTNELAITVAQIGLAFTPTVVPVPPEFELATGSTYGRRKRYAKLLVFATDTMTMAMDGETIAARDSDDLMGQAPAFGGDAIFQYIKQGASEIHTVTMTQPFPINWDIRGMYGEVELGE